MATFAKATFNGKNYSAARPTYPKQLFDLVFRYHESGSLGALSQSTTDGPARVKAAKARWDLAVDLGCGTGQSTVELHPFKRIVGVDPSNAMLDRAKQYVSEELGSIPDQKQIEFVQSSAEDMSFLEDGSVDLLISSQAAHWLNWDRVWPELARLLRQGGTAAIWCYSQMRLPQYPSLLPLIQEYMESDTADPKNNVGPYWEQPGRRIVDNHLRDIPSASKVVSEAFENELRVYFTGSYHPSLADSRPVILRKTMTYSNFDDYLRSFSAFHTFQTMNPEDASNPDGDVAQRFLKKLKKSIESEGGNADELVVEWPLSLILAKRA